MIHFLYNLCLFRIDYNSCQISSCCACL